MKLPITDRFLWILYDFFEKTGEVLEPPEILQLRGMRYISVAGGTDFWKALEKKKQRRQYSQFINYLKKSGLIKIANLEGKRGMLLTPKGQKKVLQIKYKALDKRKRKDGKWLMIMYDIPEKRRGERFILREFLRSLGYQKLQDSVWVTSYDVWRETEKMIRTYGLDGYIKTFVIEEISA